MKFSLKKILTIFIIAIFVIFGVAKVRYISRLITFNNPEIQKYSQQIKEKIYSIKKNRNENQEIMLAVKSKKNDLDMALNSLQHKKINIESSEKENILKDEKNLNDMIDKIKNLKVAIKDDVKNKNYSAMLNHMDSLISTQTSKLIVLQKLDSELTMVLSVLH